MTRHAPGHPLSAEARRGERRVEACRLLREARTNYDLTTEDLASDAGITRQALQKAEDETDVGHPVHADVLMTPAIAREVVRLLAKRVGMIAIDVPIAVVDSAALSQLASIQRETSDVVSTALESFADGAVTRSENTAIRTAIREAQEALAKLDAALAMTSDEPVASVHSIGAKR